jgi:[acyl-carrier-protein] S-malonyltransferase
MEKTMSNKVVFIFPGQGAQYVGMGKDFYDQYLVSQEIFEEADELLSMNFSKLIFEGPADELTLTKNSQLAIFITSMAILRAFEQEFPDITPAVCAGLSLGEYTALCAAGKISFADCLLLVQARGLFMHEACTTSPGTMRVVLGMEVDAVREALSGLKEVWIANLNCPGQVVIAGTLSGIETAAGVLKEKGAKRVLPLDVSGAFHSPLMADAQTRLSPLIEKTPFEQNSIRVVMNAPGREVSSIEEMKDALKKQVTSPVLWEKGIRGLEESGVELYIEIGCGKTLSGMNKKIGAKAPTFSIEKITDITEFKHVFAEK